MKKTIFWLALILFFVNIVYLSWQLPQAVLTGGELTDSVKNSMIFLGFLSGIVYFLREKSSNDELPPEIIETESEENQP